MKLTKHSNHRNPKYLSWLRTQNCVVTHTKAQCAHHIRLGTNGGSALKPSDYFCIPLLNEHHTTGGQALHIIGEATFLKQYNLNMTQLFIEHLRKYLEAEYATSVVLDDVSEEILLAFIIELIEEKRPKATKNKAKSKTSSKTQDEFYIKSKEAKRESDRELRKKLKAQETTKFNVSLRGNEFYEKSKELKRAQDKELRERLKQAKPKKRAIKSTGNNDFYQKAKEAKRIADKELRARLKEAAPKKSSFKSSSDDYYQKAKEAKRAYDKELRSKNKERVAKYRKEQYQRAKELSR